MTRYHAVMIGEDRMEFGADVEADTRDAAYAKLEENYPESRVEQLESPSDAAEREHRTYDLARRGADFDEDGRPFFPHGDEDDDDFDDEDATD